MTDVRSMLRAERTARRIDHEDAHYTSGGMLMCRACELPIKSDALWPKHIQSKAHRLQSQRKRENAIPVQSGKKRKAVDEEETERKKSRAEDIQDTPGEIPDTKEANHDQHAPPTFTLEVEVAHSDNSERNTENAQPITAAVPGAESNRAVEQTTSNETLQPSKVDEDEWAAFEREIATLPPELVPVSALNAAATIEAAPMTAEEIAARAREEASTQRSQRDVEVEAEKEDAARQLEEELDEMENYEERVRKLKEKREALRSGQRHDQEPDKEETLKNKVPEERNDEASEDDDDDEIDDEWDGWHMKVT